MVKHFCFTSTVTQQYSIMSCMDLEIAAMLLVYIRVRRGTSEETLKPGFILKYLKLNIVLGMSQSDESSELCIVYFAAVHFLDEHPHKNWFGPPVEVWRKVHNPQVNAFVPIRDIVCRCAYIITKVKFNHHLLEDITTVIPINYFTRLV